MSDRISDPARRRPLRSFVRRTGRITRSQNRALDELWPEYGIEAGTAPLEPERIFGRRAPVVLEIGFGNGDVLADMAAADLTSDFLGIEVHRPGIGHCLLRAQSGALTNLRIIEQDAVEVLAERIPGGSLARVNLFFPDPWPKKRHHKRRIVQPPFVALVAKSLSPGGLFHVATDWQPYAEHIDEIVSAEKLLEECPVPDDRTGSRFERRGLGLGHTIWERAWRR